MNILYFFVCLVHYF